MHIKTLNLPELEKVGSYFLAYNLKLERLNAPMLKCIGRNFLYENESLVEINAPLVRSNVSIFGSLLHHRNRSALISSILNNPVYLMVGDPRI